MHYGNAFNGEAAAYLAYRALMLHAHARWASTDVLVAESKLVAWSTRVSEVRRQVAPVWVIDYARERVNKKWRGYYRMRRATDPAPTLKECRAAGSLVTP